MTLDAGDGFKEVEMLSVSEVVKSERSQKSIEIEPLP
jgi:hypothetical protein